MNLVAALKDLQGHFAGRNRPHVAYRKEVRCPYCGAKAMFVMGDEIYPERKDLYQLCFYLCKPCDAYVGCHKPTRSNGYQSDIPLGGLANSALRRSRRLAHSYLDPLWKESGVPRGAVYAWLAKEMGIPEHKCHIGAFNEGQCQKVVELCALKDL